MRTFMQLSHGPARPLPAAFAADDVRYPDALVEYCLGRWAKPGDTVLDPFAGYGTTLRVAERLGRVAYGLEIDPARADDARGPLDRPERLIQGDARQLATYGLAPVAFVLTSPPYMARHDPEDPFSGYAQPGRGYAAYLADIKGIFSQVAQLLRPGGHAVIEAANLKTDQGVTTLAWDIAGAVGEVLRFEGEVVVGWDHYGYGYDHSYCLVFAP